MFLCPFLKPEFKTRNLAAFLEIHSDRNLINFDELIADRNDYNSCPRCKTRICCNKQIEFSPTSKYFILSLNRQNQEGIQVDVNLGVTGLDVERTVIGGRISGIYNYSFFYRCWISSFVGSRVQGSAVY